jgi:hypothetical protein
LEILFPGGSMDMAIALYEEDAGSYICNETIVEAIRSMHAKVLGTHIFEIGSGTGGTTSSILLVMRVWAASLTFTDLSDTFLVNARA